MKKVLEANYYVTEDGKVFNSKGHQLSLWKGNNGYLKVKLRIDGKPKDRYIHRLVAQAFVPNPDNLPQVKHKDDNKTNCHYTNLEWGTNQENTQEGYDRGCYKFKTRSHKIRAVHKTTGEETVFKSIRELDDSLGYNRKTVTAILKGDKMFNNFAHDFYYECPTTNADECKRVESKPMALEMVGCREAEDIV